MSLWNVNIHACLKGKQNKTKKPRTFSGILWRAEIRLLSIWESIVLPTFQNLK
jgi:hypothetical protein